MILQGRLVCAVVLLSITCLAVDSPGLSIEDGVILSNGKPYCGMGVNYFSLFYRRLKDNNDRSYEKGLADLSRANIPFVRFMACGFWPVEWDLYLNNRCI